MNFKNHKACCTELKEEIKRLEAKLLEVTTEFKDYKLDQLEER